MESSAPAPRRTLGVALVLGAAVLWSAGGIGVSSVDLPPLAIAGYRATFAAAVMALDVLVRARRSGAKPGLLLRRPRLWAGAVSYAVMVVTFVLSAKIGSPSNAILIQYSGPVYVALLAWPILRERLRPADVLAIAGCLAGLAIFFGGALAPGELLGNAFAVLSSFGFAGLPLALLAEERALHAAAAEEGSPIGRAESAVAPLLAMTVGNALAALACAPAMIAHRPTASGLGILAALGTFQIAVPYILYGLAVRHLRAVESSLLATIEPLLTPLWLFLFRGELPGRSTLLGGGVIVGAVALQSAAAALTTAKEPAADGGRRS